MKRCRRNIPLEICFVETLAVSGFNYFRRRSFIQYMYEGNKTFLAFLLRARGLNNQWRIQRRSQIEKLVVVSVRSNFATKKFNTPFWTKVWTSSINISGTGPPLTTHNMEAKLQVIILSPKSNIPWQKGKQAFHANTRFGLAVCNNNVREPAGVLKLGCYESRFDFQTPNVSQTALSFRPPSHEI